LPSIGHLIHTLFNIFCSQRIHEIVQYKSVEYELAVGAEVPALCVLDAIPSSSSNFESFVSVSWESVSRESVLCESMIACSWLGMGGVTGVEEGESMVAEGDDHL
jgi:hypothetical protein